MDLRLSDLESGMSAIAENLQIRTRTALNTMMISYRAPFDGGGFSDSRFSGRIRIAGRSPSWMSDLLLPVALPTAVSDLK
jgi:hypothetical protein